MTNYVDIALLEKPETEGLFKSEINDLFDLLKQTECYPMEVDSINGTSVAMGFITPDAANRLSYSYGGLNDFIRYILNDINNESKDGFYKYKNLDIYIGK